MLDSHIPPGQPGKHDGVKGNSPCAEVDECSDLLGPRTHASKRSGQPGEAYWRDGQFPSSDVATSFWTSRVAMHANGSV
eukprot:3876162-Prymnesium_polylepis.1